MEIPTQRNLWVDYLRLAITVLVVAHHASLSYTTFAWFDAAAYINSTHPIVDTRRWVGMDIFENFNDVFFMSLMFLIGGLFLIKSINKKGTTGFIRDRFFRLFVPFILPGTIFMLIAYFPSYYVAKGNTDLIAYVRDFFTVERWPVGPPWFIWLLFSFNLLFALFHRAFQKAGIHAARWFSAMKNSPFNFFMLLFLLTFILYVPMAFKSGAGTWTGIGPFDFQLSRIFQYFGYFALGIVIGNSDINNGLFSTESAIVKKWRLWVLLSLVVYIVLTAMSRPLEHLVKEGKIEEFYAWMIYYSVYAASCTLSCIAFITVFRKLVRSGKRIWNSLSENAYLIYLIHYIFIVWCQFMLLNLNIPAFFKFLITFSVSFVLSWGVSILFRKIELVKKYL
ncbi:MAG: acyltransferase [Chitinispirillaceae bacterium]|nr:acyltransferase [Chitinispirillaceae bacterium]